MPEVWHTECVDFFQKLLGYKEPTIIVLPGEDWVDLSPSKELHAAVAKRARREKWETGATSVTEFHCLALVRGTFSDGQLEITCLGTPIAFLTHEQSTGALEKMRADNGLKTTAVRARASIDEEGRWRVSVLV